jgi:putative transposase
MDRTASSRAERLAAVRAVGLAAIDALLRPPGRERREFGADATDRRAIPRDAVLRQPADGEGAGRQSHADSATDAVDGIEAIYPKRRTTSPAVGHKIYPYLLRNLEVLRPDQVWSTDITYVPLQHGFLYLVAVMDWFSRHVLSWRLSNTLEGTFCIEALEAALAVARPDIFNSDQGCQFTAAAFTSRLESRGIAVSMDGRGRAIDNVFVERLWRSVKYEEVCLRDYADGWEAQQRLEAYFRFYSHERIHQALDYRTPADVYRGRN